VPPPKSDDVVIVVEPPTRSEALKKRQERLENLKKKHDQLSLKMGAKRRKTLRRKKTSNCKQCFRSINYGGEDIGWTRNRRRKNRSI